MDHHTLEGIAWIVFSLGLATALIIGPVALWKNSLRKHCRNCKCGDNY